MVKAHLLIPEDQENIMYSWLINFQYITEQYYNMYKDSKTIENESDIYIFSDPTWTHPFEKTGLEGIEILPIDGYDRDFSDAEYKKQFVARINDRVAFIEKKATERGGYDELPAEALE